MIQLANLVGCIPRRNTRIPVVIVISSQLVKHRHCIFVNVFILTIVLVWSCYRQSSLVSYRAVAVSSEDKLTPFAAAVSCSRPIITMFTTFKLSSAKLSIVRRTLHNWASLRPSLQPVLYITNEQHAGSGEILNEARVLGWQVYRVPLVAHNTSLPVLKNMFRHVFNVSQTKFYGFANGDILFTNELIETLLYLDVSIQWKRFLISSRRTNVDEKILPNRSSDMKTLLRIGKRGTLFLPNSADLFITTSSSYPWHLVHPFVVGRVGYDNWLLAQALIWKIPVVDITNTAPSLHQTDEEGNRAGFSSILSSEERNRNLQFVPNWRKLSLGRITCAPYSTRWDAFKSLSLTLTPITDPLCLKYFSAFNISQSYWFKLCPRCDVANWFVNKVLK